MLAPIENQVARRTTAPAGIRNTDRPAWASTFSPLAPVRTTSCRSARLTAAISSRRVGAGPAAGRHSFNGTGPPTAPITSCRSRASAIRTASCGSTTHHRQRRVRQQPVLRHRCLRVPPALPAPGDGRTAITNSTAWRLAAIPFYSTTTLVGCEPDARMQIDVQFNQLIDPNTINASSVLLIGSGGDGIFGNGNARRPVHQPGRQAVVRRRDQHAGHQPRRQPGLTLPTDAYRLILLGSGSHGPPQPAGHRPRRREHRQRTTRTGRQLALPSGDGFPGGNFYDTFIINTTPPRSSPGTFQLDPGQRHQHRRRLRHQLATRRASSARSPSPTRPSCPLAGQTAIVDVGIAVQDANGTIAIYFDPATRPASFQCRTSGPNAGTGLTDANGNFTVTVGSRRGGHRAGHQHHPAARLALQRRIERPADPAARHGERLLRGPGPGDRPERQPVEPRRSELPANFVVDTATPDGHDHQPDAQQRDHHADRSASFTVADQREHGPDALHDQPDPARPVGPQRQLHRHRRDERSPSTPTITVVYQDATPRRTGGTGREQITFTDAEHPGQRPLSAHPGRAPAATRSATSPATLPAAATSSSQFAVFDPEQRPRRLRRAASFVTDPTKPQGDRANPFPTITAALAGRRGRRPAGGPARRLHRERHAAAVRQPGLGRPDEHRHQLRAGQRPGHDHPRPGRRRRHHEHHGHGQQPPGLRQPGDTNSSSRPRSPASRSPRRWSATRPSGAINPNAFGLRDHQLRHPDREELLHRRGQRHLRSPRPATNSLAPQIINNGIIGNINGIVINDAGGSNAATIDERHQQHVRLSTRTGCSH